MHDETKAWLQNAGLLLIFAVIAAWALNGIGDTGAATLTTDHWRWLRFIPLTIVGELLFFGLPWIEASSLWRNAAPARRYGAAYWGFMAANIVLAAGMIGLRGRMMLSFVGYTLADVATVAAAGIVAALVVATLYMLATKKRYR